ncbi:MAG TPA: DNA polymerase III subunit epsilon, partial [Burkholderiales bacterium]|nr:DNA polymerase III subunit epsilon [Burkholderiales bacterium]
MRCIVLDTETTGLNAALGDRIIELGCVEILNRRPTGNDFHRYVNPERASEAGARQVHGIDDEFLRDKPKFGEIATELLEYLRGAEVVIHNAAFDIEFLNNELKRLGLPVIEPGKANDHGITVVDSLALARELHPGKKNSLDALCERYAIENAHRTLHGALLDARLLADVYLAMTRGQDSLAIELDAPRASVSLEPGVAAERVPLLVLAASADELAEHDRVLAAIDAESKGRCLWKLLDAVPVPAAASEVP